MIHSISSVAKAGLDILQLQIRKFLKNFFEAEAIGQKIQNIDHTYAHAPNAWASPAFPRFYCNSIKCQFHT